MNIYPIFIFSIQIVHKELIFAYTVPAEIEAHKTGRVGRGFNSDEVTNTAVTVCSGNFKFQKWERERERESK